MQVTWMVCRKFQFQVFNYLDENGKGTLKEEEAVQCTRATAFLVADHLSQLLINDGMSREGAPMPLSPQRSVHSPVLLPAAWFPALVPACVYWPTIASLSIHTSSCHVLPFCQALLWLSVHPLTDSVCSCWDASYACSAAVILHMASLRSTPVSYTHLTLPTRG